MAAGHEEHSAAIARLRDDHNTLSASIERTDANPVRRPIGSGGEGSFSATDC
jgi:hypothetical protein